MSDATTRLGTTPEPGFLVVIHDREGSPVTDPAAAATILRATFPNIPTALESEYTAGFWLAPIPAEVAASVLAGSDFEWTTDDQASVTVPGVQ